MGQTYPISRHGVRDHPAHANTSRALTGTAATPPIIQLPGRRITENRENSDRAEPAETGGQPIVLVKGDLAFMRPLKEPFRGW